MLYLYLIRPLRFEKKAVVMPNGSSRFIFLKFEIFRFNLFNAFNASPLILSSSPIIITTPGNRKRLKLDSKFDSDSIFSEVGSNPTFEECNNALKFCQKIMIDGVVVIGGGSGTLSEICAAYMYKKPIVALKNSGGIASKYADGYLDHRKNVKIVGVETPQQAIKYILEQINT